MVFPYLTLLYRDCFPCILFVSLLRKCARHYYIAGSCLFDSLLLTVDLELVLPFNINTINDPMVCTVTLGRVATE